MTNVEQLEKAAAAAETRAQVARAKMEEQREAELAARDKRQRQRDERIVATASEERERLTKEAREAYDSIIEAAKTLPVVAAIAAFRAAREAEWGYISEVQNAQSRLGLEVRVFTPELREVAIVDMLEHAVRNLASELAAQAQDTHAAELEAFLSGDTAA